MTADSRRDIERLLQELLDVQLELAGAQDKLTKKREENDRIEEELNRLSKEPLLVSDRVRLRNFPTSLGRLVMVRNLDHFFDGGMQCWCGPISAENCGSRDDRYRSDGQRQYTGARVPEGVRTPLARFLSPSQIPKVLTSCFPGAKSAPKTVFWLSN